MIELQNAQPFLSIANEELLEGDEVIAIVDDFADIVGLLQEFLQQEGFQVATAGSAAELRSVLAAKNVALVLLDIGLPDADGIQLLPELKQRDADLAVVMLTAVTDLQTALACLRYGADDYLTKPVHFTDLLTTLRRVLEKRRLTIRNRLYQRQIEQATYRLQLAHKLAMKMNTAYLSMTELDEMLYAILVGITAEEGLQFNRAFLALFDESGTKLQGRMAIGPGNREDGERIWRDLHNQELELHHLFEKIRQDGTPLDPEVNRIVRALEVDAAESEHILLHAVNDRRSVNVVNGQSSYPVSIELLGLLQEDTFVIVPLYSPSRSLGVIIADHFVTRLPITEERIDALESFAGQASLAIEHCHLYVAMQRKIQELEAVTLELERNKDLLVESERYSALGHMAAQLAHNIKNPITAIGGTARLLAKKIDNTEWLQFLGMMAGEAAKIEKTLDDLYKFVEQAKPVCETIHIVPLIRRALLLYFNALHEHGIRLISQFPEVDPLVNVDARQIQQALVHLFRNSIEAMPMGGELTVAVRADGDAVHISIGDTGYGFGETGIGHATDPFFTTKMMGTGMGLTLVRRIMEDHGGQLALTNKPTGGMEARLTLQRADGVDGT